MISRDVVFHEPLLDEEVEYPILRSEPNGTRRKAKHAEPRNGPSGAKDRKVGGGAAEASKVSDSSESDAESGSESSAESDAKSNPSQTTHVWYNGVTVKNLELHPFFIDVAPKLAFRTDMFDGFYRSYITTGSRGDPMTIWAAMKTPQAEQWIEALYAEIDQLLDSGTLIFRDAAPKGQRKIDGKWVLKVKRGPDGEVNKLKARLVARGFMQTKGVDFAETYASTASPIYQRILFALSAQKHWARRQIDIVGAYLSGVLHHNIYMKQFAMLAKYFQHYPQRAKEHGWTEEKVIELGKPLYGLKQAGHEWQQKLRVELSGMGFIPLRADKAIYRHKVTKVIVSTHVDDFQVFASDERMMDLFIEELGKRLRITDLGEPEHYLGMRVIIRHDDSLSIVQDQYIKELLEKYDATDLKGATTPHAEGFQTLENPNDAKHGTKLPSDEATRVRAIIGSAYYATTMTRPDLAYSSSVISRGQAGPREGHQRAIKRLLRYLTGTVNMGITYQAEGFEGAPGNPFGLVGYCDASYGAPDSKPVYAYLFMMGGGPISWASRKTSVVPRSTGEAEYIALSEAAREAAGIRNFMIELDLGDNLGPLTIRCDSTTAKRLAENGEFSARTRHIRCHFHYARQEVDDGNIVLEHVPDSAQIADSMTKPAKPERFLSCRTGMGLEEVFRTEEKE
jgi:hypothetical protein